MNASLQQNDTTVPTPSNLLVWTMRAISFMALCVSGYLAWTAFNSNEVFGCGGGNWFSCDHVLTSKYSKIAGVPVSVPAFGLYSCLLVVLCFFQSANESVRRLCWKAMTFGAFSAGMAAVWFIGLQFLAIGHLCAYCLVAHSCGLILAGLILWHRPLQWRTMSMLSAASLAGIAVLITGQLMAEEPESFEVERFDVTSNNTQIASLDTTSEFGAPVEFGAPEEFGAPVEFGAPIDFAPPVEFEPPTEFAPPAESVSSDESNLFDPPITGDVTSQNEAVDVPVLEVPVPGIKEIPTSAEVTPSQDNITSAEAASKPALSSQLAAASYMFFSPTATKLVTRTFSELLPSDEKMDNQTKGKEQTAKKPVVPKQRLVTVSGNRFSLNTRHWPLLGNPDAKYVFVEMFDYTCPHCRHTHHAIDGALKKYGNDLAVIALPVPLERSCNDAATGSGHYGACELAKISVAVWRIKRDKFKDFHDWMFEATRSTAQARSKAEQLVGKAALQAEMKLPHATNYILKHVDLYKKVGRGPVPKLMFPQATMTGQVASTQTLCTTIERELASK